MDGMSHRAIARELGIAPSTAYKRVQHGLHELQRDNAAQAAELRNRLHPLLPPPPATPVETWHS